MGRGAFIDWLPILTGEPSPLFKPSDFDAAMAELDEYLKPHVDKQPKPK
jgi:hypothetical protein